MTKIPIKRALISLSDKGGAVEFATGLTKHGVEILSTGGTAALLRAEGIVVTDVAGVTGFPEIMDGRVKTLHPMLHGALLGRRDDPKHQAQMEEHGIQWIDLVAVNLYAFAEKAAEPDAPFEAVMEQVDIGGPCMIRAAAKNHRFVAVVVDPADYGKVLAEMEEGGGALHLDTRIRLAAKAFELTASYDAAIHNYFRKSAAADTFPGRFTLPTGPGIQLRYGENPHQAAVFYPLEGWQDPCVSKARKLGGKQLSYNNFLDTDAAFELVKEFNEPAAVIVKHTNPCGAAIGGDIADAFNKAFLGDPLSAFGGIAALNRPVDQALAEIIADPGRFLEVLIAPDIDSDALEVLKKKVRWGKNLRVLSTGPLGKCPGEERVMAFRGITGGLLAQSRDFGFENEKHEVVTRKEPDKGTLASLRFAWKVVKHVRSNAIVLAKDRMVVGVGAGQTSRIDAVHHAGRKAGEKAAGAVMASDAFFPFRDCVDLAAELGVKAIIQPGGSIRDAESIEAANEHGITMVFTATRHFRH